MGTAKALRQVELLARIVCTFDNVLRDTEPHRYLKGTVVSLTATVRDLKMALVQLDIARSEETPSIYLAGDR